MLVKSIMLTCNYNILSYHTFHNIYQTSQLIINLVSKNINNFNSTVYNKTQ